MSTSSERTEWGIRRLDDGELILTTQLGHYAPHVPMVEEDARCWTKNVRGYEVVSRSVTTISTEWECVP